MIIIKNVLIQTTLKNYEKYFKLVDNIIKDNPNVDVSNLIQKFNNERKNIANFFEDYKSLENRLNLESKENLENKERTDKIISQLNEKIDSIEKYNNSQVQAYESELTDLRKKVKNYQKFKEKNEILHNMIYQLYYKLIDIIQFDKNINTNDK